MTERVLIKEHLLKRSENENNNVGQFVNYGNNENSESDSEEDFQDGKRLLHRTRTLQGLFPMYIFNFINGFVLNFNNMENMLEL